MPYGNGRPYHSLSLTLSPKTLYQKGIYRLYHFYQDPIAIMLLNLLYSITNYTYSHKNSISIRHEASVF